MKTHTYTYIYCYNCIYIIHTVTHDTYQNIILANIIIHTYTHIYYYVRMHRLVRCLSHVAVPRPPPTTCVCGAMKDARCPNLTADIYINK